jgi:hypothetical protein
MLVDSAVYPCSVTVSLIVVVKQTHGVIYEGVSKVLRTGAAIYTEVVVARSTGIW